MQKQLTEKQKIKLEELEKALELAELAREEAFAKLQAKEKEEDAILEVFQKALNKAQAAYDKAELVHEKRMICAEEECDIFAYKYDKVYDKVQEITQPKRIW